VSSTLRFYGHLLMRRLPVMFLLFFSSLFVGLIFAFGLPATYSSEARMVVQGQAISEDLATSTVQIAALEEVQLMREQLVTRANLIEIANDFDIYENIREMTADEVYREMLSDTTISNAGGDRASNLSPVLMTISFDARTPEIAAGVVNEYVTRILGASVRLRTGQASETLTFFEQEVARLGDALELRSRQITEFQRENADALPDDQEFRLQRQSLLQERLAAAERERRELDDTRERTIQIFEAGAAPQVALPPDQQQLQELEAELADLLLTFSESSTRVQILQRRIARLEERIALQANTPGALIVGPDTSEPVDPLLALQLTEIDARMESLDATILETERELETLAEAIARAPINGIQLQRLERDYENVQLQFENARTALAQASIGERLEVGGRGQRITILEPPVLASRPTSPNRLLLAAGSLAVGLMMALAYFMFLEFKNQSVRRPEELQKALGVTPFIVLPQMESSGRRVTRQAMRFLAVAVTLIGPPAALWAVHTYVMPLEQLSRELLANIGLA
jgi:uncharacterized protein involved in exopolysaccharide biosynthesis